MQSLYIVIPVDMSVNLMFILAVSFNISFRPRLSHQTDTDIQLESYKKLSVFKRQSGNTFILFLL